MPLATKEHSIVVLATSVICWDMGWIVAQHGGRCKRCVKDCKGMSLQMIVMYTSSSDTAYLTFKFMYSITVCSFQSYPVFWEMLKCDQMNEFCIWQGSAVTFFRCDAQMHSCLRQISSRFCLPKLIKTGSFWTVIYCITRNFGQCEHTLIFAECTNFKICRGVSFLGVP